VRGIAWGHHGSFGEAPLAFPRLGSQDMTGKRVPPDDLATSGQLEPLGGAPMSFELQLYFSFYQNLYPPEDSPGAADLAAGACDAD